MFAIGRGFLELLVKNGKKGADGNLDISKFLDAFKFLRLFRLAFVFFTQADKERTMIFALIQNYSSSNLVPRPEPFFLSINSK